MLSKHNFYTEWCGTTYRKTGLNIKTTGSDWMQSTSTVGLSWTISTLFFSRLSRFHVSFFRYNQTWMSAGLIYLLLLVLGLISFSSVKLVCLFHKWTMGQWMKLNGSICLCISTIHYVENESKFLIRFAITVEST